MTPNALKASIYDQTTFLCTVLCSKNDQSPASLAQDRQRLLVLNDTNTDLGLVRIHIFYHQREICMHSTQKVYMILAHANLCATS